MSRASRIVLTLSLVCTCAIIAGCNDDMSTPPPSIDNWPEPTATGNSGDDPAAGAGTQGAPAGDVALDEGGAAASEDEEVDTGVEFITDEAPLPESAWMEAPDELEDVELIAPEVVEGDLDTAVVMFNTRAKSGRAALGTMATVSTAVTQMKQAVELQPTNARAQYDLARAYLFDGMLTESEEAGHWAVYLTRDPKLAVSALTLLATLSEATNRREGALAYYVEAVSINPLAEIATAVLDETDAERPPSNQLHACLADRCGVTGASYDSLLALCEALQEPAPAFYGTTFECRPSAASIIAAPQGALQAAAVLPVRLNGGAQTLSFLVAKTDAGWTVIDELAAVFNPGLPAIHAGLELKNFELRPILGEEESPLEIFLEYEVERSDIDLEVAELTEEEVTYTVICGLDDAGEPGCVLHLPTEMDSERDEVDSAADPEVINTELVTRRLPEKRRWELSVDISPEGEVDIDKEGGEPEDGLDPWLDAETLGELPAERPALWMEPRS